MMYKFRGFHDDVGCDDKKIKSQSPGQNIQRVFVEKYQQTLFNSGTISVFQHVTYQIPYSTTNHTNNWSFSSAIMSNISSSPSAIPSSKPVQEVHAGGDHLNPARVEDVSYKPKLRQRKKKSNRVRFEKEVFQKPTVNRHWEIPEFLIWMLIFLFVILIGLGVYFTLQYIERQEYCTPRLRNHVVLEDVGGKLVGQFEAVENISNAFANLNQSHLFLITGMTGVGKTMLVRSVMTNFQWHENMHHMQAPFHLRGYLHDEILERLSKCGYNLVIIDGLKADHVYDLVPFVNKMFRASNNLVMIFVFNVDDRVVDKNEEETTYYLHKTSYQLKNILRIPNIIEPETVIFRPLYESDIRECVLRTMKEKEVVYNFQTVENIMKHLSQDKSGCKRVDAKVAIAKENQKHVSVWDIP